MPVTRVSIAGMTCFAALLAGGGAIAEGRSPNPPPLADCSTFAQDSQAYRECLSGLAPGIMNGQRGTSPDTLERAPPDPTGRVVPGTTPSSPVPGDPISQPGMAPSLTGDTPPGAPSGETSR